MSKRINHINCVHLKVTVLSSIPNLSATTTTPDTTSNFDDNFQINKMDFFQIIPKGSTSKSPTRLVSIGNYFCCKKYAN